MDKKSVYRTIGRLWTILAGIITLYCVIPVYCEATNTPLPRFYKIPFLQLTSAWITSLIASMRKLVEASFSPHFSDLAQRSVPLLAGVGIITAFVLLRILYYHLVIPKNAQILLADDAVDKKLKRLYWLHTKLFFPLLEFGPDSKSSRCTQQDHYRPLYFAARFVASKSVSHFVFQLVDYISHKLSISNGRPPVDLLLILEKSLRIRLNATHRWFMPKKLHSILLGRACNAYCLVVRETLCTATDSTLKHSILSKLSDHQRFSRNCLNAQEMHYLEGYGMYLDKHSNLLIYNLLSTIAATVLKWIQCKETPPIIERCAINNIIPVMFSHPLFSANRESTSKPSILYHSTANEISRNLWPEWEVGENHHSTRRTLLVSEAQAFEYLGNWLDSDTKKHLLIQGFESVAKAAAYMISQSDRDALHPPYILLRSFKKQVVDKLLASCTFIEKSGDKTRIKESIRAIRQLSADNGTTMASSARLDPTPKRRSKDLVTLCDKLLKKIEAAPSDEKITSSDD